MRLARLARVVLLAPVVLHPSTVWAQQASGVAGTVRDSTGSVLPGVTVEAASPVLIEKVRSVSTDGGGQYSLVDLRPGIYVVTFTLPGFNTVRREGVELTAGFTATVNADMRVGALEETVTVTGASPLVDTRNVRQQSVVSNEIIETLPTGTIGVSNLAAFTPGLTTTAGSNVGGSAGTFNSASVISTTFHGKRNAKMMYDGMVINSLAAAGATGFIVSPATLEEWTVETGGGSAESAAATGVVLNVVPKEGGNVFRGTFSGLYANENLQSNNLTDELKARGLTTVNKILDIYSIDGSVGGPIRHDKVWFFTSHRLTGNQNQNAGVFFNATQGTPFYTPDSIRPGFRDDLLHSHAVRFTWQATTKNKFNIFTDVQRNCVCRGRGEFEAPEVAYIWDFTNALTQVTWTSPVTSRFLLEAGVGAVISHNPSPRQDEVGITDIGILEQSTGFRYNARADFGTGQTAYRPLYNADRFIQRFAASYVTGAHAIKAGLNVEEGLYVIEAELNGAMTYRFFNGTPNQVTQYAQPFRVEAIMNPDLGVFVQDRWTIKRATLNLGVRFDYLNAYVPAQVVPAGPWVPERSFEAVSGVPTWMDLSPRMGVSYDLFGNGLTAIRASLGRYLGTPDTQIAQAASPMIASVNAVNRTWNDANQDFVPDCNLTNLAADGECGAVDNQNFGRQNVTTRYSDSVVRGFGNRDYIWDLATEVQQQLLGALSVTAGYYRNWVGNLSVTDNLEVRPADYDPYMHHRAARSAAAGRRRVPGLRSLRHCAGEVRAGQQPSVACVTVRTADQDE